MTTAGTACHHTRRYAGPTLELLRWAAPSGYIPAASTVRTLCRASARTHRSCRVGVSMASSLVRHHPCTLSTRSTMLERSS
jgi:hypothetical protein